MAVRRSDSPKQKWTRERKIGASLTVIPLLFVASLEFFPILHWLQQSRSGCTAALRYVVRHMPSSSSAICQTSFANGR